MHFRSDGIVRDSGKSVLTDAYIQQKSKGESNYVNDPPPPPPTHTHTHTHNTEQIMIVYYDHELDSNNFSDILVKIYTQQMMIMVKRTGEEEASTEGVC